MSFYFDSMKYNGKMQEKNHSNSVEANENCFVRK